MATDSTLNACKACLNQKVKRLVITNSIVAINMTQDPDKVIFDSDDVSDITIADAYT